MTRRFIEQVRIQEYGCLRDVSLNLTPLHALIGPNDSGKSTVLMALRTMTTLAAAGIGAVQDGDKLRQAIWMNPGFRFEAVSNGQLWRLSGSSSGQSRDWIQETLEPAVSMPRSIEYPSQTLPGSAPTFFEALAGSMVLRLEPDELRKETQLIPDGYPLRFMNELGCGLPAIYDAIVTRDLAAYSAISAKLGELFPTTKGLHLKNPSHGTKALGVQLNGGTVVPAQFMSEGMLYYLAYAAMPHLERVGMILIEEPENGLHPARIREVMMVLKEISKTTQVVIATHSPLVINELEGEQVSVLTRDTGGTQARLLKDTPNFAERSKVYALGELWVSYADGNLEAPLFAAPEAASDPGEPIEWSEAAEK